MRDLSRPEIEQLAITVKQLRCSSCGGPIDLGRDTSCSHCKAAISVLDNDAVVKALAELNAGELHRTARAGAGKIAAALHPPAATRYPARENPWLQGSTPAGASSNVLDLVADCIDSLFDGSFDE